MRQLEAAGWRCVHDPDEPKGEVCVINTCGFIGDAKEESINMILQMAERKKKGKLRKLIVMGCLSERYRAELEAELPEVDEYYGKFDFEGMVKELGEIAPRVRPAAGINGIPGSRNTGIPKTRSFLKTKKAAVQPPIRN